MALEIERKFLVRDDSWKKHGAEGVVYRQAYLFLADERGVLRLRVMGGRAVFGLKIGRTMTRRLEYEYDIPLADAEEMLREVFPLPTVDKRRYRIAHEGMVWEVDEYLGANEGLVVAEIELEREDQPVSLPPWVGREVTEDPRYLNFNLYLRSWAAWV